MTNLVSEGKFRKDLYYRLLGLPIELPPLRDRGNDVILLAKHFVNEFCKENEMETKDISEEARKLLLSYHFPGNIRELNLNIDDSVQNLLANEKSLEEYNHEIIKHFLNKYNHNVRLVATKLGIGKSTIYRLLQKKDFD